MFQTSFLLSMPGGSEWIIVILLLVFIIIFPVLALMFYLQAKKLRLENKELMARLSERNK